MLVLRQFVRPKHPKILFSKCPQCVTDFLSKNCLQGEGSSYEGSMKLVCLQHSHMQNLHTQPSPDAERLGAHST